MSIRPENYTMITKKKLQALCLYDRLFDWKAIELFHYNLLLAEENKELNIILQIDLSAFFV